MLDHIIRYSVKNKLIVGLLVAALAFWGVYSVTKLPIDAVPDITNNQVQVITSAPSQTALDIERLVTFPIEQAVATIPGITEVRSFSRFGLSVITIVFEEDVDVYWARQQVSERLSDVKDDIPAYIGNSKLAPVTTGLGEIYQYTIFPKQGYEDKYSATDLRTIQDWLVRRQLLGVKGVADVSSFGGYLKQYEVAVNTDKLLSMQVTISEVIDALEKNNKNTGGAYIDSKPKAYFIRTEGLVGSKSEIEEIVVKVKDGGIPVLIRDVAVVQEGHAIRYGALTHNDDGEAVGGIVMMLKGANSSEVIANVKERIGQIRKNLPEGVEVDAYLDRTKLVNNAIGTVATNLTEGALIVIFVLVLLLGNMRAGLIVASVIPLSMLFAFSMMRLFGVSGNLMSLGAIDFGLIVDGAVIIVEATMYHLSKVTRSRKLSRDEMDTEVMSAASRIRTSAAFGEIIILIVYLPILALSGIEGKMFGPMAQTVSFAIFGAFLLSLTYVPMMSALFLKREASNKRTFSDKLIERLQVVYEKWLVKVLSFKKQVVAITVLLFAGSLMIYNQLGAEFLPSLDEGDYAIETRVMTGSSLSETISAANKAAEVILKEFPDEVTQVVGKIGSGEIPTDPMPIEACDLMVILADKDEWVKADSKEELTEKMSESLEQISGVSFGFMQPIQMRFNELMTGAKQDVVVKVYGEDLDMLTSYSNKVAKIVSRIDGAKDLYQEQVTGLSQIVIDYNRNAIARYGLSIDEVNKVVNTAFAGYATGKVYEGEKRFDMVVRLENDARNSIRDVQDLMVNTASGVAVPLSQLADVSFKIGPNQIQRDDAKRRIVIGFNVRGRDVASIVEELQQKVDAQIKFAPGYYTTYGGVFENLQQARGRLMVAVPIALLLIFVLLYLTFNSIKQGLMIFTAIPMSAIGGILALWLRGMPFSISAAIGFIALFGVAVLNGIVLIAEFNRIRKAGVDNIKDIIMQGTKTRLRPVIMTATVASLGFLPMALSQGSGAEVQKPLATVVIGGLITATLLTLFVLPCLYCIVEKLKPTLLKGKTVASMALLIVCLFPLSDVQSQELNLEQLIEKGLKNNYGIKATEADVMYHKKQRTAAYAFPHANISGMYGQYNSHVKDDNNYTITQTIPFPTELVAKGNLARERYNASKVQKKIAENELIKSIQEAYYNLQYLYAQRELYESMDSVYSSFAKAAELRYQTGESTLLESSIAKTKKADIENERRQNEKSINKAKKQLQVLLSTNEDIDVAYAGLITAKVSEVKDVGENPTLNFMKRQVEVNQKAKSVSAHSLLPDITVGYFNQTLIGAPLSDAATPSLATSTNRFSGFQVGLSIPLWIGPEIAKVKANAYKMKSAFLNYRNAENSINGMHEQAMLEYQKQQANMTYYKQNALPNAALISVQSAKAYKAGEINYTDYLISLQQVLNIKLKHLKSVNEYNMAVVQLNYITGVNLK